MSVEERKALAERNKDVVRRYTEELWNNLQYDLIDQVLASDVLAHAPDGTQEQGNRRFRQVIPYLRTAFPDLHMTIEQMIAEDDHVAVRLRVTGTHQEDFAGMPPTGKVFAFPEWVFLRLWNGKIVEYWYLRDQERLLQQLRQA
jgi:steroid delta-isomerase-like uncharacterized protein